MNRKVLTVVALLSSLFAIFLLGAPSEDSKEEKKSKSISGTWKKKANSIKGTWKIEDGKVKLTGFSTKGAPDLKIFLPPTEPGKLKSKNVTSGAKLVAKLKSDKGDQTYALPKGVDLSIYKSIIIHCERYTKLWGVGSL